MPNGMFVGLERTVDFSSADLLASSTSAMSYAPRRDSGVSARVFGKIGYTNALFRDRTVLAGGAISNASVYRDGIRLGVGTEVPITEKTYLKAEYNYSNYADGIQRDQLLTGFGIRF
jgi:outer membrane autotransporter protein